jgi:hypothetical protein
VHFFDAASHPLTLPDLAVAVPAPRR